MRTALYIFSVLFIGVAPSIAFAAPGTFAELVDRVVLIVDLAVPALVSAAVVFFMYNVLGSFGIFSGEKGGGVSREKFNKAALWGIVIIFVIVSIWGILQILEETFLSADSFTPEAIIEAECARFEGQGC